MFASFFSFSSFYKSIQIQLNKKLPRKVNIGALVPPNQLVSKLYPKTFKSNTKMILKSIIKPLIDSLKINFKSDAGNYWNKWLEIPEFFGFRTPFWINLLDLFARERFCWRPVFGNLCMAPLGPIWTSPGQPLERFALSQGTLGAVFLLFLWIQEQVCSRSHAGKCLKKSLKIPHPPSSRTCRSLINPPSQSIWITRVSNIEDHED